MSECFLSVAASECDIHILENGYDSVRLLDHAIARTFARRVAVSNAVEGSRAQWDMACPETDSGHALFRLCGGQAGYVRCSHVLA